MFLKKKKSTLFNKIKNKNLYLSQKKKWYTIYIYENNMFQKKKLLFTNKILV